MSLIALLNISICLFEPTAKPLHQHGSDCLRLKVDVVGPHGKPRIYIVSIPSSNRSLVLFNTCLASAST